MSDKQILDARTFYEQQISPNNSDKTFVVPGWAVVFAERYADCRLKQRSYPTAVKGVEHEIRLTSEYQLAPEPKSSFQQTAAKGADTDELWDEFSRHIDDDIDSLSTIAGSSVITERDFKELMKRVQSPTAAGDGKEAILDILDWVGLYGLKRNTQKHWYREGFPDDLPKDCATAQLYDIFKNRNK